MARLICICQSKIYVKMEDRLDPDQVKRKDYQTVLLTGLDSSWFQDREATKVSQA